MTPAFAFFTFLNAFWIMLFFSIPFCVTYEEKENIPANEKYAAAPKSINWKKVIILATLLAILVTALLALIIKSDIIQVK